MTMSVLKVNPFILNPCGETFILEIMAAKTRQNGQKSNPWQTDEVQAAIDYGIDVSMLMANIGRTPTERIIRHQIALNTAEKLRKARHL